MEEPAETRSPLAHLLEANVKWADALATITPDFFENSASGQHPKFFWIGCSDSRVPDAVVTGSAPGEIFTVRNVANLVNLEDHSLLAVLSYAVEFLGVEHILVVGHSGCGGAGACLSAVQSSSFSPDGPIVTVAQQAPDSSLNRWLRPLTLLAHSLGLSTTPRDQALPILVEENVKAQVDNLCKTEPVQAAWKNSGLSQRPVQVHGLVYDLATGRLRDLGVTRDATA